MSATEITATRRLTVKSANGPTHWKVTEFDGGHRYMLIAEAAGGGVHVSTHFTGEQWAEFQQLVAGRDLDAAWERFQEVYHAASRAERAPGMDDEDRERAHYAAMQTALENVLRVDGAR